MTILEAIEQLKKLPPNAKLKVPTFKDEWLSVDVIGFDVIDDDWVDVVSTME